MNKGVIILIVLIIVSLLMILGTYFLVFSTTDKKISKSQEFSEKTYYLAEAGINEAIWKLNNDDTTSDGDVAWKTDFIDPLKNPDNNGNYWTASFTRSFNGGTYSVSINNFEQGHGRIISTATIPIGNGKTAQRIVKTAVFKALSSPVQDSALFTGGTSQNLDVNLSNLRIIKGNIFSNNNLNISGSTVIVSDNIDTPDLEGKALAVNNYNDNFSSITDEAACAKNVCTSNCPDYTPGSDSCPPDSVSVPIVDFDSINENSFKSRALVDQNAGSCQLLCNGNPCSNQCILSASQFSDLLWSVGQGGTLTLNNKITYITGVIDLKGGVNLEVNGTLISDDNIYIGESYSWTKGGQKHMGLSQITVNRPLSNMPSGILAKRKINFGPYSSFMPINITGVIYSNDEIRILSIPQEFNILGGVIVRKFSITSLWQWLNITLDNDIILYGLGYKINGVVSPPLFSPIVTVEHWEESY